MASILNTRSKDLGGFSVKRILPHPQRATVGPFVFFDHMGPAEFAPGEGIGVRPHPHIGLATITYLFEGSMLHRDSLGNCQEIVPGEVNWMTAGRGIVHSERETIEVRNRQHRVEGLQVWVALPQDKAETEPEFFHVKKESLPHIQFEKIMTRLLVGEAYGEKSPVKTYSRLCYLDVLADTGSTLELPTDHDELALYIQRGSVNIGDSTYKEGDFVVLKQDERKLDFADSTRLVVLGGEKLEKPPHLFWNFVSFDKSRIEKAKQDWIEGRFPGIPGDDREFIPLPD